MKLLLAIDVQKGMVKDAAARQAAQHILELAQSGTYGAVWGTRFINPGKEGPFQQQIGWEAMQAGDSDTRIWEPLTQHLERVFDKRSYGLFPPVVKEIKFHGITQVDLVGFETDACVLAVAFQLFDQGLDVRLLADGCSSGAGPQAHQQALQLARRQFGKQNVITTQD